MVFSSILFLFSFLPITIIIYYLVPQRRKNLVLLIASCFFYAWGEPVYIVLMLFSVVFNYYVGLDMEGERENKLKCRFNLVFAVVVDLFVLFYFKYAGFVCSIFHLPHEELALPIGISFYTFQTLSYVIDVYLGKVKAQRRFIDFAVYVTMFPQLIAGPIVKYIDIEKQLKTRKFARKQLRGQLGIGAEIFIKGLSKKVLLANNIGNLATTIQQMEAYSRSVTTAWIGAIAYTLQIYFDFSGYSDMAIGLGKMFGFEFLKNFDYPYLSKSVTEFWRRWHMSLGTWFREYVYIPLGGNRVSNLKHIRNILIVWFLTGLWHGASWNFVIWGVYYGLLLLAEKYFLRTYLEKMPSIVQNIYTMILVIIGWVLFMSNSMEEAWLYLKSMFGSSRILVDTTAGYFLRCNFSLFIVCIICCGKYPIKCFRKLAKECPQIAVIVNIILFILSVAFLVYDTYNPFLYFRF